MNEFLKMDIFFVLTSIAVILVSVGLIALMRTAFRILRNIERMTDILLSEGVKLSEDMERLRQGVLSEELHLGKLMAGIFRFIGVRRKKKNTKEAADIN